MYTTEQKRKSPFAVFEFIVVALMIIAIIFMLTIYFSFRETGSAPKIFGYYIYHTHAVNMAPEIPAGTAVFAKESEIDKIGPNSVVLCRIDNTVTLILVVDVLEEESGTFYIVRYKTSPPNETYKIPKESVIAKALSYDDFTGRLLDFGTSKAGIILAVIVPSLIIILIQIIRIAASGRKAAAGYESDMEFGEPLIPDNSRAAAAAAANAYARIAEDTAVPSAPKKKDPERKKKSAEKTEEPIIPPGSDENAPVMGIRAAFDVQPSFSAGNVLAVDSNGHAEYAPRENTADDVLMTGDKLYRTKTPPAAESTVPGSEYRNEPARITAPEEDRSGSDIRDILSNAPEDFRPGVSDVLPEGITKLKGLSAAEDESVPAGKVRKQPGQAKNDIPEEEQPPAEFFSLDDKTRNDAQPLLTDDENERSIITTDSIPENAVRPREAIAPRRKQSTRKTIEELMNMIDAEQKKISRASDKKASAAPAPSDGDNAETESAAENTESAASDETEAAVSDDEFTADNAAPAADTGDFFNDMPDMPDGDDNMKIF